MKRVALLAIVLASALLASSARADETATSTHQIPQPDGGYAWSTPQYAPNLVWTFTQLVPSPEVGFGRIHKYDVNGVDTPETQASFGLRWQVTPILWSWGVHRRLDRWRFLVVDPLARNAGSIAFDTKIEYFFGHVNRFLARPGIHATLPLVQRGEYLSTSLGTSVYQFDDTMRVSYDAGLYVLYGILGTEVSYAPTHAALRYVATVRIRYF